MIINITTNQSNLLKELCLIEINNCFRQMAINKVSTSNDSFNKYERVYQLYRNRADSLQDILDQLDHLHLD